MKWLRAAKAKALSIRSVLPKSGLVSQSWRKQRKSLQGTASAVPLLDPNQDGFKPLAILKGNFRTCSSACAS
jgi:hypothetical protein